MHSIDVTARTEQAVANFKAGYNCAQSVVMAYADLYKVDAETLLKVSAPLGGGMGRLREVCGAVSGMFLILGLEHPATNPNDKTTKTTCYEAVQRTGLAFKEKMGSYICADLLHIKHAPQTPTPEDRNADYYAKRPCAHCVAQAATILGNELKRMASF